ncbi:MAG TPA: hypothetical protein VNM90_02195, partial [Haliangium sp.]|nr:hypothetical protein [Haliangium sp.]
MRTGRMLTIPAHRVALVCLLGASGCAQLLGIEDLPDITDPAPPPDADPSVPDAAPGSIDAEPGPNCGWPFAPRHFDPCSSFNPVDLAPLVLDAVGVYTYDTDNNTLRDPGGAEV